MKEKAGSCSSYIFRISRLRLRDKMYNRISLLSHISVKAHRCIRDRLSRFAGLFFLHDRPIDFGSGLFARAHRKNNRGRAGNRVAARIYAGL